MLHGLLTTLSVVLKNFQAAYTLGQYRRHFCNSLKRLQCKQNWEKNDIGAVKEVLKFPADFQSNSQSEERKTDTSPSKYPSLNK